MISAAYAAGDAVHHAPFYATPEFWVAMAFVSVVAFAARPVFKAVVSALDARSAAIQAKLDGARSLREDAQTLLADYQRRQRDALKEVDAILRHATEEVQRLKSEAEEAFEKGVSRREQQALERIKLAEHAALSEVRGMAVDLGIKAAETLIVKHLDDAAANALVDESIKSVLVKMH
ncbi:F0F1 ATP synthase subunit B [Haematospirillum jordaniae]|uniref:F0F1 ATP synthase subunit B family protein n=1 Tax=Haematospirillum jordaniae TaxID=1549855 RepID=UPI001432FA87|nr:F0F1 ATP synthase subunit B [Haematospirillum jordaniae]NKD86642.1 F0F1 ATP synthase subunit B [Haematospirillum jordaniae]